MLQTAQENDGFKKLEVTQKELQLCLRSAESFDPQGALDSLCSGVQSLQAALEAAETEKKQLQSTVEKLRCLLKASLLPEQQRAEKVERLRRGIRSDCFADDGTTGDVTSLSGAGSPPGNGAGSAAGTVAAVEAQECSAQNMQGLSAVATGTISDSPDLEELCTSIASFSEAVTSLRCQPQEADAVEVAKALRLEAEPLIDRGNDKDLDCLRRDLKPEKHLQSLTDLMSHLDPYKEDDGGMGKVIKGLAADIQGLIEEFQGNKPVDFSKEDAMMQSHIKTYIYDVINALKQEQKSAELLSTNLEFEGEKLCERIKELSEKLSAPVVQKRGFVERQRMEKMQHLMAFYARRVMTVTSQNKPAEKLQEKRMLLEKSSLQDIEDYKRMQNYQQERAAELSDQQLRLKDFVANKEKAYHREVKQFSTIRMSLRLLQRHHVARVTDSLQALFTSAVAWSAARVRVDEAHIASMEAVKLERVAAPRLKDAEITHWQARGRLVRAEGLLGRFGRCLDGAYVGLLEKAEHDRQECTRNAPEYGVRYLQVSQKLFGDASAQMALLENLRQKSFDKGCALETEIESLEYAASDDDDETFNKKKKELEGVYKQLDEFGKDISFLKALQESETDDKAVAEEAAREADPSVPDKVERWLKDFHFGGAGRKSAFSQATPRLMPGQRLQLEPGARQQDADDDTATVRSCSDFCIIESDTIRRIAEDVQAQ